MWKVYSIQTGQIVKAGFAGEEEAKTWLEENREGREDNYLYEEMDDDEEIEWTEANEKYGEDEEEDQSFERERYNYSTDDEDDGDDDENAGMSEEDVDILDDD